MQQSIQMTFTPDQVKILASMFAATTHLLVRGKMHSCKDHGLVIQFDGPNSAIFATLMLGVTQDETDFPTLLAKLDKLAKPFTAYMRSELTHTNEVK